MGFSKRPAGSEDARGLGRAENERPFIVPDGFPPGKGRPWVKDGGWRAEECTQGARRGREAFRQRDVETVARSRLSTAMTRGHRRPTKDNRQNTGRANGLEPFFVRRLTWGEKPVHCTWILYIVVTEASNTISRHSKSTTNPPN